MSNTSPLNKDHAVDPHGPTGRLCAWISNLKIDDIPAEVKTRAKYLILDGIACALVGAHLPWSETAAHAILEMEGMGGVSGVIGWQKVTPFSLDIILSLHLRQVAYYARIVDMTLS